MTHQSPPHSHLIAAAMEAGVRLDGAPARVIARTLPLPDGGGYPVAVVITCANPAVRAVISWEHLAHRLQTGHLNVLAYTRGVPPRPHEKESTL